MQRHYRVYLDLDNAVDLLDGKNRANESIAPAVVGALNYESARTKSQSKRIQAKADFYRPRIR